MNTTAATPVTEPLIDARSLSKQFGGIMAVDKVSLQVHAGEAVGFMGPNGAGKTTTMRLLAGYLQPDEGMIKIAGIDMTKHPQAAQQHIGYLPEQSAPFGALTVREHLHLLACAYGVADVTKAITTAANLTLCDGYLDRPLEELSKGQRQRAYFAGALLHNPDVLILDEPTDGLDPNQKHEMRLVLKELAKHKALLISTHILEEAEAICSRVVLIAKGRIVTDTTPADLKRTGKGDIQAAFRHLTTAA
ncbi:MAG: ABC transporter ATP-binding protein [Alphaproteobacteria bacterium]